MPAAPSAVVEPVPPERRARAGPIADPAGHLRSALRASVCTIVLLAPLPFGAVVPWAVLALELSAAACGALAIAVAARAGERLGRTGRFALWAAAAIAAVGALQLVPLPPALASWLAPSTTPIRRGTAEALGVALGSSPIALEPRATLDALLRFGSFALLAWAAAVSVRRPRHLRQIATALALSAGFQAIYGSMEYLSGRQHIFGYAKIHYGDEASGTFINRNHFAAYLAMALPAALALTLDSARALVPARRFRDRVLALASADGQRMALGAGLAASIWIGIVLSYSRSGFAVALVAVGLLVLSAAARRRRAWIAAAVLAVPTLFLLAQEVRAPGARFAAGEDELLTLHGRLPVWEASLAAAPRHLPLGSGLGSFGAIFPVYRPEGTTGHWSHAHNDWLESLLEGGPVVTVAVLALLVVVLLRAFGRERGESIVLAGAGAGVVVLALHGAVDFPVRIPAIAATGACLVGCCCARIGAAAQLVSSGRRDTTRRPWNREA
jgi:O-antigen ligase